MSRQTLYTALGVAKRLVIDEPEAHSNLSFFSPYESPISYTSISGVAYQAILWYYSCYVSCTAIQCHGKVRHPVDGIL